ncbi:MAG TPA: hypothetical protein VMV77_08975 [Bacteroidales bacterium]|nr:hypothetical protein [Bacteroidales bacterium]
MKKSIILLFLLAFTVTGFSQELLKGFLTPGYTPPVKSLDRTLNINGSYITVENAAKGTFALRPTFGLKALAFYYDQDLKQLSQTSFDEVGIGVRYQHFTLYGEELIGDWSINAIVFSNFGTDGAKATFTPAITFNALKYLNAGIARDGKLKKVLFLTALTYNF